MLNQEQQKAFDLMLTGKNVFLTGNAGTGKSYLLNEFIKYQEKQKKKIIVTAPTGIAAINVGGTTIHRAFKVPLKPIGPDVKCMPGDILRSADIIIIDEISMVRFDVFYYIWKTINTIKNDGWYDGKDIQLIVVGDFFQLPPVVTYADRIILRQLWKNVNFGEGFAFGTKAWNNCDFKSIVLKTIVRQKEPRFINALNNVRHGDIKGIVDLYNVSSKKWIDNAIYLCGTNEEAKRVNEDRLKNIAAKEYTFRSKIAGKVNPGDKPVDDIIKLKVGARVIIAINDTVFDKYQNGSMGTVETINNKSIVVKLDSGKKCTLKPHKWEIVEYALSGSGVRKRVIGTYTQMPVKLGYAITMHKSQGQTFNKVNINPQSFCEGQLYVGLSRCTNPDGLYIKSSIEDFMNHNWLMTSDRVVKFYNNIE